MRSACQPAIDEAGIEITFQKIRILENLDKKTNVCLDSFDMVFA